MNCDCGSSHCSRQRNRLARGEAAMPKEVWTNTEVIVSIKARGVFTSKHLRFMVEDVLDRALPEPLKRRYPYVEFGKLYVKQRAKVETAEQIKARAEPPTYPFPRD